MKLISGLIGFIFRVIIFNPMALIGIALGYYLMQYYGYENIPALLKMPIVYEVLFGIGLIYSLLFKHVYRADSVRINWFATAMGTFGQVFNIVLAAAFTCAIIYSINYGFPEKFDSYLRHENTQETGENEGVPINQSSY